MSCFLGSNVTDLLRVSRGQTVPHCCVLRRRNQHAECAVNEQKEFKLRKMDVVGRAKLVTCVGVPELCRAAIPRRGEPQT